MTKSIKKITCYIWYIYCMSEIIYGQTGTVGKDGLLTPEQQSLLGDIQQRAAEKCYTAVLERQPDQLFPMVGMATGIGKGNIIHRVIEREISEQMKQKQTNSRILVIAGTKIALVTQTHEALANYQNGKANGNREQINGSGMDIIETEETDRLTDETEDTSDFTHELQGERSFLYRTGKIGSDREVQVATIQTLQSKLRDGTIKPEDYDLVIVDEVHNIGTKPRREAIQQFKNVVGFTATPFRHSGSMKNPEQYGFQIVDSLTLPETQRMGLLPPLAGIQIDTKELLGEIPMTNTGLIDYKKLEVQLKKHPELREYIVDKIVPIISSDGRNYKTVIPVNFVWEAQEIAELLRKKGIKVGVAVNNAAAKEIHSEDIPALDALERYKLPDSNEKSIQVLISPNVASEGFDAPFTECLVWASPTDSPLRYTQYTGRLARRSEGKAFGVIVDCLYQTSQYSWSYNMGMWMKGDVRQLDNGLLWLGPENNIGTLKEIPAIKRLQEQNQKQPIDELQNSLLLDLQPTDFAISSQNLENHFRGARRKYQLIVDDAIQQLQSEDPSLIQDRKHYTHVVTVVTDRERFIKEMIIRGIELKDNTIQQLQPSDFVISSPSMKSSFIGEYKKVMAAAEATLGLFQENHPMMIQQRRSGNTIVTVVTDKDLFIQKMNSLGILSKTDASQVQETDFPLSQDNLVALFRGDSRNLRSAAAEVIKILLQKKPLSIQKRRSGGNYVDVITDITDKQEFIDEMLKRGVELRNNDIQEVKATDFPVTGPALFTAFVGENSKVRPIAHEVLDQISREHPELVEVRRNRRHIVSVVTDRELFIRLMRERGINLKGGNIQEMQATDFAISESSLGKAFIGSTNRLSSIAEKVVAQIQQEHPELVTQRKAGNSIIITAVTNRELFIQEMQKNGIRLKQQNSD